MRFLEYSPNHDHHNSRNKNNALPDYVSSIFAEIVNDICMNLELPIAIGTSTSSSCFMQHMNFHSTVTVLLILGLDSLGGTVVVV